MSRCFPYPPPGYSRNGATYEALIESIKLQKETEKAKAERKKEKRARKEKKREKEKRKEKENEKSKNIPKGFHSDSQKGTQSLVDVKGAGDKIREPIIEQLERSDLTEEHCQPVSSHKPSYSSDSTQNSNKRKRDDPASFPDGTNSIARPIKIRLLKKHQGPGSSKETLCSNLGRTDPPNLCDADPRASNCGTSTSGRTDLPAPCVFDSVTQVPGLHPNNRTTLVPNCGKMGVSAPSKTENLAVQKKSTPSFVRPGKPMQHAPSGRTDLPAPSVSGLHMRNRTTLLSDSGWMVQSAPPSKIENRAVQKSTPGFVRPGKNDVPAQGLLSTGKQSIPSSGRPILPTIRTAPSTKDEAQELWLSGPSSGRPVRPPCHLKTEISGSYLKTELSALPAPNAIAEKKLSSEISILAKIGAEVVRSNRHEKKMRKRHLKYEKLVGSWVPPIFQTQISDDNGQDWLFEKKEKEDRTSRSAMEVDMSCRESATSTSSLWRPAARLLPEADIYALPFTVPF